MKNIGRRVMRSHHEDECGWEERERKTEAQLDGQRECGLAGEGTAGGGDA